MHLAVLRLCCHIQQVAEVAPTLLQAGRRLLHSRTLGRWSGEDAGAIEAKGDDVIAIAAVQRIGGVGVRCAAVAELFLPGRAGFDDGLAGMRTEGDVVRGVSLRRARGEQRRHEDGGQKEEGLHARS